MADRKMSVFGGMFKKKGNDNASELTPLKGGGNGSPVRGGKLARFKDDLKIYCVVKKDKDGAARKKCEEALRRHWERFQKKVRKRFGFNINKEMMIIKALPEMLNKNMEGGCDEMLIEVAVKLIALEYQAAIDQVKVQIEHGELDTWIEQMKGAKDKDEEGQLITRACEGGGLFPSTHFIYVNFDEALKDKFVKDPNTDHFLSEIQQIWLVENIFNFDRMVGHGKMDSYFALHNPGKEDLKFNNPFLLECSDYTYSNFELNQQVSSKDKEENKVPAIHMKSKPDIFDRIREYYGEQVGLYFRFVTHMAKWTLPLGFVGLLCQGYILYTLQIESPLIAVYAVLVIIWANMFTEVWKRIEAELAYRWGMEGFETNEESRYQFETKSHGWWDITHDSIEGYDFVDGRSKRIVNNTSLAIKQTFSSIVIVFIMGCVLFSTIMVYKFKSFLQMEFQNIGVPTQFSATCASVLNTVQIMIFKYLYSFISTALNDMENHRTQTEFEDSMISKLTIFSFFNSYNSFFYIAFVAGSISVTGPDGVDDTASGSSQCGLTGCMGMLSENLLIVLLVSLSSDKLQEFVVPLLSVDSIMSVLKCKCCCGGDKNESKKEEIVENYKRSQYDFTGRLADYTSLFILFGYLVMFSPALPIAAVLVAGSTAWESRGDLMKLYQIFRRVQPQCAEDIGAWQGAFEVVTVVGVVSNSGLIVFTMGMFSDYTFQTQMWIFIGMQWLMFTLLAAGGSLVADDPHRVVVQRRRTEYYNDTLPPLYDKGGIIKKLLGGRD